MKKWACLLLACFLCVSIVGCSSGQDADFKGLRLDGQIIAIRNGVYEVSVSQRTSPSMTSVVNVVSTQSMNLCVNDWITVYYYLSLMPFTPNGHTTVIAHEIIEQVLAAKPVIYFYPQVPTVCSAEVIVDGRLTCTYPDHGTDGWENFTAYPDGTLVFPDGREYYALYWEGVQSTQWDFSQGWCVPGDQTAEFLEWALAEQGLSPREANEFIIYWLPLMQENAYNIISFQTTAYTDSAVLEITPAPDSMLRVFMAYYPSETPIELEPQSFDTFQREGFTVVEWGGSQVTAP